MSIPNLSPSEIEYPCNTILDLILNNSPYAFYLFQWVPYQTDAKRYRLKLLHDVKTFDGKEEHGIWPNGNTMGSFKDDEVEFIRISKHQLGHTYVDPK